MYRVPLAVDNLQRISCDSKAGETQGRCAQRSGIVVLFSKNTNENRERDRRARVNELLEVLGLEACSEVRVGNPLERGISGGEARRLSMGIGVAALESVRLLLLDEPTTVSYNASPFSPGWNL